jgi:hypothetical protein
MSADSVTTSDGTYIQGLGSLIEDRCGNILELGRGRVLLTERSTSRNWKPRPSNVLPKNKEKS